MLLFTRLIIDYLAVLVVFDAAIETGSPNCLEHPPGTSDSMDALSKVMEVLQGLLKDTHPDESSVQRLSSQVAALNDHGQEVFAHVMGVKDRASLMAKLKVTKINDFKALQVGVAKAFGRQLA